MNNADSKFDISFSKVAYAVVAGNLGFDDRFPDISLFGSRHHQKPARNEMKRGVDGEKLKACS